MDFKVLNLKQNSPSVQQAIALLDINLDIYKSEGVTVVKIIHGYGSHGIGGAICFAVRNHLRNKKKNGKIKDMLLGNEWDMSNGKCLEILTSMSGHYLDEDLNNHNPGITIVVL